jgi:hypothetical protein
MVAGSTYTVTPASPLATIATHSAYTGLLLRKRRMIRRSRVIENASATDRHDCGSVLLFLGEFK